ncbi:MAG: hypothetical protein R6X19_01660 [Kiritimatiellia bacterium]
MNKAPSFPTPSEPEQTPLQPNASAKTLVVTNAANPDRFLADILKAAGYQPLVAGYEQALERLAAEEPAGTLIGLTKDTEVGLKTVRKIQMRAPGTACIILKNSQSRQAAIQTGGLGAYLYATPPLDMELLPLFIRRTIERQEAAAIRGETPDAIVGKTLFDLCPEIAESHLAGIRQAMDSGNEMEHRAETGLTTFRPIRNSKGHTTAVQVIECPATER